MSADYVAAMPLCEECRECRQVWLPSDQERWQAHWIDHGPEEKLVFYCPDCARRDFDE